MRTLYRETIRLTKRYDKHPALKALLSRPYECSTEVDQVCDKVFGSGRCYKPTISLANVARTVFREADPAGNSLTKSLDVAFDCIRLLNASGGIAEELNLSPDEESDDDMLQTASLKDVPGPK